MKFLVILIIAGIALASAAPLQSKNCGCKLEKRAEENDIFEAETESTLDEVKQQLKERVNEILRKIKEVIQDGKLFQKETIQKLRELGEKLKNELGKEGFRNMGDKTVEFLRKILERFGGHKRAVIEHDEDIMAEGDSNVFGLFEELKKMIKEKFDFSKVKEFIENVFGRGSEVREILLNWLKMEGGKQKILDFIDRLLGENDEQNSVISDYFQKIKNYFNELNIELHEKYAQFGHWVKQQYEDILEKGRTNSESLRLIATEFLHDTRMMSKHMAVEAKFFFTEYRKEIGDMFDDVMKKISKVLNEKETQNSVISDYFQKIKDYFNELNIELHEKYAKFGHWLKEQYEDIVEKGKTKEESLRQIATEFLHDSRTLSKHMAVEAKFFFNEYKNEIGDLFGDVMKKISKVLNEKETQHSVISDYFQKIKDYFNELNIELLEKYAKFGHWLKEQYEDIIEKGKTKEESLRQIATEFLHDSRTISKHMAVEAKFFFTEYKKEIGDMFDDVMRKISKVLNEKETQNSVISDYFQKIKDYFNELNVELHEKYAKFGHWLKEQYEDIVEKGKTKEESLKQIATEFLHDSRAISKHMAVEAKFFFNEYRKEIGDLFGDVMKKISKVLNEKETQHSVISDYFQKIKDYFNELNIELHEKYAKFGHWLKEQYEDIVEKGKTKEESLRQIATEFLHDSRSLSKHMAVEAKFFFTEYRNEIGNMFDDVMKKITKVLES